MDRAWLRAERVLYASTHTLPGLCTLLDPPHKRWGDERRHANTSKISTTAGEKKRERGVKQERRQSRWKWKMSENACVCVRLYRLVCVEKDRKCEHCTQDSECKGTMNHSEDKWVKIKRDRGWSDSMPTVNGIFSSTLPRKWLLGWARSEGWGQKWKGWGQLHLSAHILHSI